MRSRCKPSHPRQLPKGPGSFLCSRRAGCASKRRRLRTSQHHCECASAGRSDHPAFQGHARHPASKRVWLQLRRTSARAKLGASPRRHHPGLPVGPGHEIAECCRLVKALKACCGARRMAFAGGIRAGADRWASVRPPNQSPALRQSGRLSQQSLRASNWTQQVTSQGLGSRCVRHSLPPGPVRRKFQCAITQSAEPESHEIQDVVLVIPPRLARSLPR